MSTLREKFEGFTADTFGATLVEADDWPFVIMTSSVVENFLEAAITLKFENPLTNAMTAEMFSGYGPLASFSAKISIAYALGLIAVDDYHDLRLIKKIRNSAAHTVNNFSLETGKTPQYIQSLKVKASFKEGNPSPAWANIQDGSLRKHYLHSYFGILANILGGITADAVKKVSLKLLQQMGSGFTPEIAAREIEAMFRERGFDWATMKALR